MLYRSLATPISCTWPHPTTACAAFSKESRMKFANANKLHRKSGRLGLSRPGKEGVHGEEFLTGLRNRESIYIEFFTPLRYI